MKFFQYLILLCSIPLTTLCTELILHNRTGVVKYIRFGINKTVEQLHSTTNERIGANQTFSSPQFSLQNDIIQLIIYYPPLKSGSKVTLYEINGRSLNPSINKIDIDIFLDKDNQVLIRPVPLFMYPNYWSNVQVNEQIITW